MQKTKLNQLKASVDKLHNLAKNNDEIPTEGVLLPIGQSPPQKEIRYFTNEALRLIENWSKTVTDEDINNQLQIIKSKLKEISD